MGQKDIDVADLVGAYPVCGECGSREVVRDAWTYWNFASGEWELKTTFDHFACDACGDETSPVWKLDTEFRKKRIRRLNDALRRGEGENVMVVVTPGLQAKGDDYLATVSQAVAAFDSFSEDNDPHAEHDFGAVEVGGDRLFWKVDYFDATLSRLSADPANPDTTHRVLTIMLASEY